MLSARYEVRDLDVERGRLAIRRDVDDLGHIEEVKTYKHRDVPIGGEILQLLASAADGRDDDAWLVPDEHGNVWTTARWRKVWSTILIRTGITDFDTYELRHTAASLAIAAGADVKTVQVMLGHSSATTTLDVYRHLWEEARHPARRDGRAHDEGAGAPGDRERVAGGIEGGAPAGAVQGDWFAEGGLAYVNSPLELQSVYEQNRLVSI